MLLLLQMMTRQPWKGSCVFITFILFTADDDQLRKSDWPDTELCLVVSESYF